jgi:membrane protein
LLFFGIAVALWSTSALARTLSEAFNAAYEVNETRPGWKRFAYSLAFVSAARTASIGRT